jgi:hypothetical protein
MVISCWREFRADAPGSGGNRSVTAAVMRR